MSLLISVLLVGFSVNSTAFDIKGAASLAKSLTGTAGSSATDIDSLIKIAEEADGLMKKSLELMTGSLASKEEVAKIQELKKQAATKTDAKEKAAIEQEIVKSEAAALNNVNFEKAANDDIQKMDQKQKSQLGAASYNFLLAAMKDQDVVSSSSDAIGSSMSNPANLSKIGRLKDLVSSLSSQAQVTSSLVTKVPKIFGAVGLKNPPAKSSDKPMEIAD